MTTFGGIFKKLRERHDFSQEAIGKKLGVSKSTVSMWEIDQRTPSRTKMEEIADFFNVDMDYLYGRTTVEKKVSFDDDGKTYINVPNDYDSNIVEVIDLFLNLNTEQKEIVLSLLRSFNH